MSLPAGTSRPMPFYLASYVADEKVRGTSQFPRYALHNIIVGYGLYLTNRRVREVELLYKLRELRATLSEVRITVQVCKGVA